MPPCRMGGSGGGRVFMTLIRCSKHGLGCAAVCSHVARRVVEGAPVPEFLVPISAEYAAQVLGPTWLCPGCFEACRAAGGYAS